MEQIEIERIAHEVIRTLKKRFANFPDDASKNRNAPFHEAFLKAFEVQLSQYVTDIPYFISLSSWLHGLNTTLGQSFFENIAHIISNGEKREFSKKKHTALKITTNQQQTINEIITDLKNGNEEPDVDRENGLIHGIGPAEEVEALDFSADNFVEDVNCIEAIEMKSVRPNAGEMRGEKQKILNGKAALKKLHPNKDVKFFIAFPFDPFSDTPTGFDKERFKSENIEMQKYLANEEILIGSEFWNYLSGEPDTMGKILEIINSIATMDFIDEFEFINNAKNFFVDDDKYLGILNKWRFLREIQILNNIVIINEKANNDKTLYRILHKPLFTNDDRYNESRVNYLLDIVKME